MYLMLNFTSMFYSVSSIISFISYGSIYFHFGLIFDLIKECPPDSHPRHSLFFGFFDMAKAQNLSRKLPSPADAFERWCEGIDWGNEPETSLVDQLETLSKGRYPRGAKEEQMDLFS